MPDRLGFGKRFARNNLLSNLEIGHHIDECTCQKKKEEEELCLNVTWTTRYWYLVYLILGSGI